MRNAIFALAAAVLLAAGAARAEHRPLATGAFEVTDRLLLPGTPEEIFDAFTGDISGWWDHSFSGHPYRLYIEPEPGGGFWEIFDKDGNGVLHADVTAAVRGKLLRLVGPLGLAGNALYMVSTLEFEPVDGGHTVLKLTVRASGQMQEGWEEAVDATWHHFLHEQFKPYVESGKHQK